MVRESDIPSTSVIRRRFTVRGRVQGVGFRPFVYRLADELRLGGLVGNDSHGAFIEVEGSANEVEAFGVRLRSELPPLARISEVSVEAVPVRHERTFRIEASNREEGQDAEIAPDVAICEDCLREMLDPGDRRYRYPFINCMNCGPRYSIIRAVPYDRANTTMAAFRMCPACQAEYDDPANRRFHAQPNACPVCGPRLWMTDGSGAEIAGDPIAMAAARLRDGAILAVKGIGGFHLACRADSDEVVGRLRERKGREAKAFAMMVGSLEDAQKLAEVDQASSAALVSLARPIVLMPKRDREQISSLVAPGSEYYGLMLPYTPLHHLLFAEGLGALVMTSANPSEEPLCRDNDEALRRLAGIADGFLLNDRDIERRVDDSVVLAVGKPAEAGPSAIIADTAVARGFGGAAAKLDGGRVLPIRRARGLAPAPIQLDGGGDREGSGEAVLAVGGELKSSVCLLAGKQAVMSEHLGELSNAAAYRNFVQTIGRFKELLRLEPRVVAYDLHPEYAATRYARTLGLREMPVQHHHAHVVSCMADSGISGAVVGVSCDGTGYGTDGAIWGCEILVSDEAEFSRAGHLDYFPLLGGDAAAQDTWRPAAGLLHAAYGTEWMREAEYCLRRVEREAVRLAAARLERGARVPATSSLGRLFDAVAFLLGVCDRNRYEAEGAMRLETLARGGDDCGRLPYAIAESSPRASSAEYGSACPWHPPITEASSQASSAKYGQPPVVPLPKNQSENGQHLSETTPRLRSGLVQDEPRLESGLPRWEGEPVRLDVRPMVRELVERARAGQEAGALARAFHETIATMLVAAVRRVAERTGLKRVVLSGGCFANRLLLESMFSGLTAAGLAVFAHERVPTGDGGIALGQAVAAAERIRRNS